jgi:hypothetical protein
LPSQTNLDWRALVPLLRSIRAGNAKRASPRKENKAEGTCRRQPVTTEVYEDHGIRFEYPSDWAVEVTEEGRETTIDAQHPEGLGFAVVRADESRPDPASLADEALQAMREEYPDLEAVSVIETLGDHCATGHDVEFFSLDIANAAKIRCFRTPRRTVFVFGQWSDLGAENLPDQVRGVIGSIEEVDE